MLAASDSPSVPASLDTEEELSAAFLQRIQDNASLSSLTFDLFNPELDAAFLSPDGQTATLWLALRDESGRLLKTEPGFAVATLSGDDWQVLLPGDPGWEETLAALPPGMLPPELSQPPASLDAEIESEIQALTGYYLPYAAGTARWLEGSISHFQNIPWLGYPSCREEYCRYAYDFTDLGHFPLLAAKGGTVVDSRDSCPDGGTGCTNYIVLRNASEGTYQIYLHLSNGTIPDKLTPGTSVVRGQYLGDTDDTGYSTSDHVHFMVTNSIWLGGVDDQYYWGRSIDIRFADVPINNGIPRTCYEVTEFEILDGATECLGDKSDPLNPENDWFTSGNIGAYPATGSLSRPAAGAIVAGGNNPLIDVTAIANDDVRVAAVRLVAKIGTEWVEIGPRVAWPAGDDIYDWDVDVCEAGLTNGSVVVALRIWDHEGNMSTALDARTITVDYACPPPGSALKPAEIFESTAVSLSWDVSTTPHSFDIASFELQWRTEPGTWQEGNILTIPGDKRSTWFVGQLGNTYAFRLRAIDVYGQGESWPAGDVPEILVTMPQTCTPDPFEPDDARNLARLQIIGEWSWGNLCGPGDPDWFEMSIDQQGSYAILVQSQSGGAAVRVTVFASDGTTVLADAASPAIGQGTSLRLPSLEPGTYYLKVEALDVNLAGTGAEYKLLMFESRDVFLPIVIR